MDVVEDDAVYTNNIDIILDHTHEDLPTTLENPANCNDVQETNNTNGNQEKSNGAVWTTDSVLTLLKLYESKLGMLEHPKKKTRIWIAISDSLKDYDIEVTPDQVRWKINALTKRYKKCISSGQHNNFKYFTELNNIWSQYKLLTDTYYAISDVVQKKNIIQGHQNQSSQCGIQPESKASLEIRKRRLADRIESDKCQSKVKLEKQWLQYLKRQEEQRIVKDEILARKLKLREEELELRKRELEMREALEFRRLQLKEKEQEETIRLERDKCEMLKKIFAHRIY